MNLPSLFKSQPREPLSRKVLSTGGLIAATLLSLLLGLAFVVRSLKNVKLVLHLKLKKDDKAEKKY